MLIFDTRKEMMKHYINQSMVVCELGVFKGEFMHFLVNDCNITHIDGVDLFSGIHGSGDQDGNNSITTDMAKEYILLQDKYRDMPNVNVCKSHTTTFLAQQPDNKYDIIYIDADHSYKAVKNDITLAFEKIKNEGYIMGHDYELNMDKCNHNWKFGTKQAVDEFCKEHNQEIIAKGMDGCVSFCIKVKK